MNTTKLWRWNPITGYWKYERTCKRDTAADWLKIFSDDEPNAVFAVSARDPVKPPAGEKQ